MLVCGCWGGEVGLAVKCFMPGAVCFVAVCVLTASSPAGCAPVPRSTPPPPQTPEKPVLRVHAAPGTIAIDGDPKDWKRVQTMRFVDSTPKPARNSVVVGVCWDEDFLYVCFVVDDRELYSFSRENDDRNMRDDSVVVLIDTYNDQAGAWMGDDVCYQVNLLELAEPGMGGEPRPRVNDHRGLLAGQPVYEWDGQLRVRVSLQGTLNQPGDLDEGYVVEMAIPWRDIGREPRAEHTRLGLNLVVYDRDAKGEDYHYFGWAESPELLRPDTFRQTVLVK